jgi:hypothetical protein
MPTAVECALIAGASYISTRPDRNKFPIPLRWNQVSYSPPAPSGFEAATFGNGTTIADSTEIVISYAGTDPKDIFGDIAADFGLALGTGSAQLLQAAEYYLQIKAANAGANITLTGHSLGGGLAALIGVFFGVQACTFDQAPFAQTARFKAIDLRNELANQLDANGSRLYNDAVLAPLSSYIAQQEFSTHSTTAIPNAALVTNINVQGEFLSGVPWNLADRIGTTVEVIDLGTVGLAGGDLHSHALLTALLQSKQTASGSQALNEVTKKLTDLLEMIFDGTLFAHPTNDPNNVNFLEQLVRHEAGVQGSFAADGMVTRFTKDMWALAQDGGLTLSDGNLTNPDLNVLSKALMAFAMQRYYDEKQSSDGYMKTLFTAVDGGITFDRADVAAALGGSVPTAGPIVNVIADEAKLQVANHFLWEIVA